MNKKKTLLIVINVDWLFLLHRLAIAKYAHENGFHIVVAAKDTGKSAEIRKHGFHFIDLNISRSGVNWVAELTLMRAIFKIYNSIKPDLVYHITMKPVIYGAIVARLLKIKTVNAISGLGYNFTENRRGFVQKVMIQLMKFGFNKENNYLVFENKDDLNQIQHLGIINLKNKTQVIQGVGVNLQKYAYQDEVKNEKVVILLPTRMLWDKGVKEFIEAAKLLKDKYYGIVFFKLCGMVDRGNKEGVPEHYLKHSEIKGYLKWVGYQNNMPAVYSEADIVVLPSYREGLPTALIEACASGKPIVTTDAIGCKDCVDEGVNGYKVPVKSFVALAKAMEKLILAPEDRKRMGQHGREKAAKEFDQKEVVKKHLKIFNNLLEA